MHKLYMQRSVYFYIRYTYNPHEHHSDQDRKLPLPNLLAVILLKPNLKFLPTMNNCAYFNALCTLNYST